MKMQIPSKKLVSQLESDTAAIALPEGRRVGSPGHDVVREFLRDRLEAIGLRPFRGDRFELGYLAPHPFEDEPSDFTNLVGVIPGRDRSLSPILLGAHYDSVLDGPCADDNATSVALNLAIAEEFQLRAQERPLERDLIIALFDAEEPPHFQGETMGSIRFHEDHAADIDFAGVIVSDLIGHDLNLRDLGVTTPGAGLLQPRLGKTVFVLGAESDPVFPGIVEAAAAESAGIHVFPTLNRYIGNMSDHHSFEQQGQPFLFLSCGRGRHYHQQEDDLSWINFKKLGRITEFVANVIQRIDADPADRNRDLEDTADFEIRMIERAVGPAYPLLLKAVGIGKPRSRRDLDQLVMALS